MTSPTRVFEAVKNIPTQYRDQFPDIPWREVAGLRDILIHQYMSVDLKLTWRIVKNDLPSLEKKIQNLLEVLDAEDI